MSEKVCDDSAYLGIAYEVELLRCVLESREHRLLCGVHEFLKCLVAGMETSVVSYVFPQCKITTHLV